MAKIKCPGCTVEHDEDDWEAQSEHMTRHHPEIIDQRLSEAGFVKQPDDSWYDAWASD